MTIIVNDAVIPYDDLHQHIGQEATWVTKSGRRMQVIIGEKYRDDGEWDTYTIKPQGDFSHQTQNNPCVIPNHMA